MTPGDPDWRAARLDQLLRFARGARTSTGFGWLRDDGSLDPRPEELWITARMTYVWSLVGDVEWAAHGVSALRRFEDPVHGGWFDVLDAADRTDEAKRCYGHDFVLLAAATAAARDVPGAAALLDDAIDVHLHRFWDAAAGRCVEQWDRSWSHLGDYRGANSNMHAVEAYLATATATADTAWLDRALQIAAALIDGTARDHDWRVVEHFAPDWTPRPELNRHRPADPFRPYGATPGHALEWARLLVEVAGALSHPPGWLLPAAEALVERATADALTDTPLLPYTTDWDGRPVVTERFHWVMAEAVSAAETLHHATGAARYRSLADRWWREIATHLVDDDGSWRHELAADLTASSRTWSGRPDAYHAVNALTLAERLGGLPGYAA